MPFLYFKDSEFPAKVIKTHGKSAFVEHGSKAFWVRMNHKSVDRIEAVEELEEFTRKMLEIPDMKCGVVPMWGAWALKAAFELGFKIGLGIVK